MQKAHSSRGMFAPAEAGMLERSTVIKMAGLLSGLEQFGLGNLENMDLYETPAEETEAEKPAAPVIMEQDFIFDKSYTCPICDQDFKAKTVKVGKAKLKGTDMDLRPKYEHIDVLKYDVIMCPHCGYAALSRYFKFVTSTQAKNIKERICAAFKPQKEEKDIYSFEEALERYKMTLANAIVKMAKPSEKAYICLKTAWLLRGQSESLDSAEPDYAKKKEALLAQENEFLHSALEGFLAARQSEGFPMCGMDEGTVDYLIAVLALRFNQIDVASRLIAAILASPASTPRMRDKARDLKEILMKKIKQQQAGKK